MTRPAFIARPSAVSERSATLPVRVEQHRSDAVITLHDPVDGVTPGLQLLVEPVLHQLPATVQELAVHVDRLVEGVPPRLMQEAHEREVPSWCRHPAEPGRRGLNCTGISGGSEP